MCGRVDRDRADALCAVDEQQGSLRVRGAGDPLERQDLAGAPEDVRDGDEARARSDQRLYLGAAGSFAPSTGARRTTTPWRRASSSSGSSRPGCSPSVETISLSVAPGKPGEREVDGTGPRARQRDAFGVARKNLGEGRARRLTCAP